jgi:Holliday junction DNA helicase RuvA
LLERLEGEVAGLAEGGFALRIGSAVLFLHAPRGLLSEIAIGRHVSLPVHLQLQIEGNRMVPVMVAFGSDLERELFEDFLTVSGIGARAAVRALVRPADEIAAAIAAGNEVFLTTLPGIGKAKARQIVASLQEKMSKRFPGGVAAGATPSVSGARDVLMKLGLTVQEVEDLVEKAQAALGPTAEAADIVREAMRARNSR